MTKLNRSDLKDIVKECLLEILSEGVGAYAPRQRGQSGRISGVSETKRYVPQRQQRAFDPRLDTPVRRQPDQLHAAVIREAGGNPVMQSILADTAVTTLPNMLSNGDRSTIGESSVPRVTQQEQFEGDPEEVFGEDTAANWAKLAFMPAVHKPG